MVILCSTCQQKEKECIWVKYVIHAVLCNFNFVVIDALFPPNSNPQIFRVHKKPVNSTSAKAEPQEKAIWFTQVRTDGFRPLSLPGNCKTKAEFLTGLGFHIRWLWWQRLTLWSYAITHR